MAGLKNRVAPERFFEPILDHNGSLALMYQWIAAFSCAGGLIWNEFQSRHAGVGSREGLRPYLAR